MTRVPADAAFPHPLFTSLPEALMRVYTLWHEGDAGEVPWILDAVDQYTLNNSCEFPALYIRNRADTQVREMIIDIPEDAVRALFSVPSVKGTVIRDDPKVEQPPGHKLDVPEALLLTARNFSSGYAREGDVAAAAYRLAAAKLRTWGDEGLAKDLENAAEQAEKGLASEWTERIP
jgi:hypothetical protein